MITRYFHWFIISIVCCFISTMYAMAASETTTIVLTQNDKNTFIATESFDAISFLSHTPAQISFDNKNWKTLEIAEEPTDTGENITEILVLSEKKNGFFWKSNTDSATAQIFSIDSTKKYFAGPVETKGYTRDEDFFNTLKIIRREQWGADESMRYSTWTPKPTPENATPTPTPIPATPTPSVSQRDILCDQWQSIAPEDFATQNTKWSENGNILKWAHRYSPEIKKIVVHHTADSFAALSARTEEENMRAIYQYHTINRGWGDVGYHFIIGPSGKIYEGKAGGDYIVGGHVYCANAQTIGISLMGNFETINPSKQQIESLEALIAELEKKYNISANNTSWFHGSLTPNVVGHKDYGATACPGKNLYSLLDSIRNKNVDYQSLGSSSSVKEIVKTKNLGEKIERSLTKKNSIATKTLSFQNTGNTDWKKEDVWMEIKKLGIKKTVAMNETVVKPNGVATFTITSFEKIQNSQNYTLTLKKKKRNISGGKVKWKIGVLENALSPTPSDAPSSSQATPMPSQEEIPENIRIKLSYPHTSISLEGQDLEIDVDGKKIAGGIRLDLSMENNELMINGKLAAQKVRVKNMFSDILTIASWKRIPDWDQGLNDNEFRGTIEIRIENGTLLVINELPLESYLKGIAEVSDSAPEEKQKTLAVIARSYALFYMLKENRKYPNAVYDGDDSPESFQKYIGYGYEKRSPAFSKAVNDTKGKVVTFQGKLIKTPYFSESDGRTRSAKEVWGWENTPYLKAVDDTYCKNGTGTLKGHGVGLSGCGAETLANNGFTFEEILKYYYTGIEVSQ